ncbi:unnamed protein product [Arabis nemorensis]|uniref:Uncharacterized protein n=1 Tax=Arabis nemorensis TaxID=586526 RepID=A0A565AZB7_9BRAS|nr:unnamed protein product [Arabis nemorensis]
MYISNLPSMISPLLGEVIELGIALNFSRRFMDVIEFYSRVIVGGPLPLGCVLSMSFLLVCASSFGALASGAFAAPLLRSSLPIYLRVETSWGSISLSLEIGWLFVPFRVGVDSLEVL